MSAVIYALASWARLISMCVVKVKEVQVSAIWKREECHLGAMPGRHSAWCRRRGPAGPLTVGVGGAII